MYKGITLSASLMCADWLDLKTQLADLEGCNIDYLHIDIVDGLFAPDFTMGSSITKLVNKNCKLKSDYHLMAEEPSRLFDAFNYRRDDFLTIHQEACRNLHRDLVKIKQNYCNAGIALSPGTNIDTLEYIIEDVNLVLLMTVDPGYMGQPLVPQVLKKISKVYKMKSEFKMKFLIAVDGNVSIENIPKMIECGADTLVLGSSSLFNHQKSIKDCLFEIHSAIDSVV